MKMEQLKKLKKGLLAMLATFMVLGFATACAEDTNTEDTETEENQTDEGTEESTEEGTEEGTEEENTEE
jgi:hypothetical protein